MSVPAAVMVLNPRTLRELACLIEAWSPQMKARAQLSEEGLERLADILLAGGKPTIGFFRRWSRAS